MLQIIIFREVKRCENTNVNYSSLSYIDNPQNFDSVDYQSLEQKFLRDERYPSRMPPTSSPPLTRRPERLMKSDLPPGRKLPVIQKRRDPKNFVPEKSFFEFNHDQTSRPRYRAEQRHAAEFSENARLTGRPIRRSKRQSSISSSDDGIQSTPEGTSGEDLESESISEKGAQFH